jgi:hypothetical protein
MKTKRNQLVLVALSVLMAAAVTIAYRAGRARASGIPAMQALTYSGVLTDANGTPLTGQKNVQILLYDAATGGNPVCSTTPMALTLTGGAFQITLPDSCATQVQAGPDLWVDVVVDGGSLGRTKLGAVPYAIEAMESSCGPVTGQAMVDTGAGFCIDGADRGAETAYGSAIATCAGEGKMLCTFAQMCTARIRNVGGLGATTAYRMADIMFFTGDNHSYFSSMSAGSNSNILTVPAACNAFSNVVPNGAAIANFRCCRGKG